MQQSKKFGLPMNIMCVIYDKAIFYDFVVVNLEYEKVDFTKMNLSSLKIYEKEKNIWFFSPKRFLPPRVPTQYANILAPTCTHTICKYSLT
jgi:hypothetical protein